MVLRLKTRESRSLPGLQNATSHPTSSQSQKQTATRPVKGRTQRGLLCYKTIRIQTRRCTQIRCAPYWRQILKELLRHYASQQCCDAAAINPKGFNAGNNGLLPSAKTRPRRHFAQGKSRKTQTLRVCSVATNQRFALVTRGGAAR